MTYFTGTVDAFHVADTKGSVGVAADPAAAHKVGERQGLTLVHFLAQHKRFLWDRGCV